MQPAGSLHGIDLWVLRPLPRKKAEGKTADGEGDLAVPVPDSAASAQEKGSLPQQTSFPRNP